MNHIDKTLYVTCGMIDTIVRMVLLRRWNSISDLSKQEKNHIKYFKIADHQVRDMVARYYVKKWDKNA